MLPKNQYDFLLYLNDHLPGYLHRLAVSDRLGRFLPCLEGTTSVGREMSLGFSCFALKIYWTLNIWTQQSPAQQNGWIDFIRSFQQQLSNEFDAGAFVDPPLIRYLQKRVSWSHRVRQIFWPAKQPMYWQQVIVAETKQAIASLAQVNVQPAAPYRSFPADLAEIDKFLAQLDWTKPWGAGGQASALAVFIKTQSLLLTKLQDAQRHIQAYYNFLSGLADEETGAYFKGASKPQYGQLVNGAMKILTALDWLDAPIHYPEKLINTCLSEKPSSEGCHLVDVVYVLYRCLQQTEHRCLEIKEYCRDILAMIKQHANPDGGFSYFVNRSQTSYYGAKIALGLPESDIHGTCLLVWALAMVLEICESNYYDWQIIKP